MLIPSPRHRAKDLELWAEMEEADLVHAQSSGFQRKVERALDTICNFVATKRGYGGLSWGKDSCVLAHLIHRVIPRLKDAIPCFWIKVNPISNPDCDVVEQCFLERFFLDYHRIEVSCTRDLLGWHATGTLEEGFRQAIALSGSDRHISGVRGEESGERMRRMRHWGEITLRTCAPIGWWSHADVFAYLAAHNLPVHPAYGMMGLGRWHRDKIRVASLGGRRGDQFGRTTWELEYYGDILRRLEKSGPTPCTPP